MDMVGIFEFEFMRLAFVGGTIIGVLAPTIGIFLVLRRYGLIGDGLGHIAFGGVAFGQLVKADPIWMALGYSALAAVGIERLRARGRLSGDIAIAIFLSSGLALGLVLARLARRSTDQLWNYLFGSVIALQPSDVIRLALIAAFVLAMIFLARRELFFITFDEETARASGIRVGFYNLLLVLLAALTIVSAIQIVGLLLISALLVLPVAAAFQLARELPSGALGSDRVRCACCVQRADRFILFGHSARADDRLGGSRDLRIGKHSARSLSAPSRCVDIL
jgi:zinc transport system permease protein